MVVEKPKAAIVIFLALVIGYVVATAGAGIVLGAVDAVAGTTLGSSRIGFAAAGVVGLIGAWIAGRRAARAT